MLPWPYPSAGIIRIRFKGSADRVRVSGTQATPWVSPRTLTGIDGAVRVAALRSSSASTDPAHTHPHPKGPSSKWYRPAR